MSVFVLNEWLWSDSAGENNVTRQQQAYRAITQLATSEHRIVVIEGSAFDKKAWNICTNSNAIVRAIARLYVVNLRQNSNRCLILKAHEVAELPPELSASTKADDHYLLQALLAVPDAILVTTDQPLCEVVRRFGLSCLLREEFFHLYL